MDEIERNQDHVVALATALGKVIQSHSMEWDLSNSEIIGVLEMIKLRHMHALNKIGDALEGDPGPD